MHSGGMRRWGPVESLISTAAVDAAVLPTELPQEISSQEERHRAPRKRCSMNIYREVDLHGAMMDSGSQETVPLRFLTTGSITDGGPSCCA